MFLLLDEGLIIIDISSNFGVQSQFLLEKVCCMLLGVHNNIRFLLDRGILVYTTLYGLTSFITANIHFSFLPTANHMSTCFFSYQQAAKKVIENNATIALKSLATPREGELEQQEILLKFAEGTYVHHRAMRDIWRQLSDSEREQLVPSKSQVNQAYSTSFGLHVAVITADDPPKFLFCRRANRG